MNCCHDRQNKFKLMNSSVNVTTKTEAENLEKYFEVIKYSEANLQFSLIFEKIFSWLLIRSVFETYTCCHKCVTQCDQNYKNMVYRTLKKSEKNRGVMIRKMSNITGPILKVWNETCPPISN